jgi:MFS family permease
VLRRRVAIGAGGLAVLLAALDAYVVVSIIITIVNDLRLPINHLERATPIVTGYLLGYVAGMPLLARVSDRYGRRLVIYVSLAGFVVGSYLTATSGSLNTLVFGRAMQGLAGGALLPVTLALVADLFAERQRPAALGAVGAAQELGSVLGPLYGVGLAALIGWRGIFWVNIPLAVLAAIAVHFAVPGGRVDTAGGERPRVDVTGGLLIACGLGALVFALYNPSPDKSVLPTWGPLVIGIGLLLLVAFVLWEWHARTKLLDMRSVVKTPFYATLAASACAGAALLATLVFIQLDMQLALELSETRSALILVRFLVALPVGAVIGGLVVRRLGERWVTVTGLLIAAAGYVLISQWPVHVLSSRHDLGFISIPRLDTDLVIAGLGLGLVIAPLSAAVLRVTPATSHGIASAGVVVARMMGMLLGVSALAAWGLHRFQELTKDLPPPLPFGLSQAEYDAKVAAYNKALDAALQTEYREIFIATAVLCVIGALISMLLPRMSRTTPAQPVEA